MRHKNFERVRVYVQRLLQCEWVIVHVWTSHGLHMNESWHTCKLVMGHMWIRYESPGRGRIYVQCSLGYEGAIAHVWMSHGPHMNESRCTCKWRLRFSSEFASISSTCCNVNPSGHTCKWVMAHVWRSHENLGRVGVYVQRLLGYEGVMVHVWMNVISMWMSHGTCVNASWKIAHMMSCVVRACVMCRLTNYYLHRTSCVVRVWVRGLNEVSVAREESKFVFLQLAF